MDVPDAAVELNDALQEILLSFEQALTRIVTSVDEGEDVELALVEGANAFNDAGGQFLDVISQADELANACGD